MEDKSLKKLICACKKIYNKDAPLKIEWIVAILIGIIMLLMFSYIDLKSLTIWSTNIFDCIAEGDISQYYSYTALNKYNVSHKYVSGTLYSLMIWAIWNIPIWLIQYFKGIEIINNELLLVWSKLFLVASLGTTLFLTYKICNILFKEKKMSKWITFLATTFIYTYIGVLYAGQNDILICMFATLGLYFLIREKNIWFYIFSALAISVKYFYLIPYIPLILLTEKKIWKIIVKIGSGISPIILFRILFSSFPMYFESQAANKSDSILKGFFGSGIKVANGVTLSFFVLAFIIICFIAYITKPKSKEIKNNYVFYFASAPIIVMLMFSTHYEFYRPILLMPILMILYGFKPKLFRINIILDTIMGATSFGAMLIKSEYILNTKYSMANFALSNRTGVIKEVCISNYLKNLLGDNIGIAESFITTIMFAAFAIILVINYPKCDILKENTEEKVEKPERWIIWMRQLVVVPMIALLLFNVIRG